MGWHMRASVDLKAETCVPAIETLLLLQLVVLGPNLCCWVYKGSIDLSVYALPAISQADNILISDQTSKASKHAVPNHQY